MVNLTLSAISLLLALAAGCSGSGQTTAATSPDPSQPSGPVTEIPTELSLPHEDAWSPTGPGGSRSPLPGICVDPPPRLSNVSPTDGRGIHDLGTPRLRTEALGVWADINDAAEAVDDWRGELALCGARGSRSHVGNLIEWTVTPAGIDGAGESWIAFERNLEPTTPPAEIIDQFYVVARVGNAVYVEGVQVHGGLDQRSVAAYTHSGSRSVSAFLPSLAIFSNE